MATLLLVPERCTRLGDPCLREYDSQVVVHRVHDVLAGAEVPLGRLHAGVPEQQLDLFQLASGSSAELRAGAPVMPHTA